MNTRFLLLAAVVATGMLLLPLTASAQCNSDGACAAGEVCVYAPCPAIDCAPGMECPVPVCETAGECMPAQNDVWYGDDCAADSDCPAGFTCEASSLGCETYGCGCACPPCDPDSGTCPECICDCPEPPPCTDTVIHVCTYSPQQCASDTDCGAGYECVSDEVCYGYGCACPVETCACPDCDPSMGSCPPCECSEPLPCDCPSDPVETCETLGSYCLPKPVICTNATDCPADWECAEFGSRDVTDCACAGCACPMPADCPPDDAACLEQATNCYCPPCDCPEPTPTSTESYCLPAGWSTLADGGSVNGGEQRADASPTADFLEHAQDTDTTSDPTTPTTSNKSDDGVCSIASTKTPGSSLPLAALGLIGFLWAMRRRRA